MKTLLVVAHPRSDSLTAEAAKRFAQALRQNGHEVELADLAAEKFDPFLREDDEPDWDNPDKQYSPAVANEMRRIERNDATVMIFPIWWWSMPALLKGWIDRVWNYGWAYGARGFTHRRVWMIGVAGGDLASFQKRGYDKAIDIQLKVGILDYCGVKEARLEVLYGGLEGKAEVEALLGDIQRIALEF